MSEWRKKKLSSDSQNMPDALTYSYVPFPLFLYAHRAIRTMEGIIKLVNDFPRHVRLSIVIVL